jgi:PPOX class probable F420-dependent enzyme
LKRLRNIEENAHVALVFDRYDEDWKRLGWVLVHGTAATIEGGAEHARAIEELRGRYAQYVEMALQDRPMIRVTVERVSSWGDLS